VLVLAAALQSPPAVAGAQLGRYEITDNRSAPGATCFYDTAKPGESLRRVKVRFPKVMARERPGSNRERVGWRFTVLTNSGGEAGRVLFKSQAQKKWTDDNHYADFTWGSWQVDKAPSYFVFVKLTINWYENGRVDATVRHRIGYYLWKPHRQTNERDCSG
jgi:hypothetical protein